MAEPSLPKRPYPLAPLPPGRKYEADGAEPGSGALTFLEDTDPYDLYSFRLSRIVSYVQTKFQKVMIADTNNYGLALFLDGAIQSTEDDEELYHEMLVQPAMLCHPDPKSVLIVGGGEGATLREVLVHNTVEHATMVDIDRQVVELCKEHLPSWHRGAFKDPRVRMVYEDGRSFVGGDERQYDVVVIDLVDLLDNSPAQALYTRQYYEMLSKRLKPGGIVAIQGFEFSFVDWQQHAALSRTLKTVFKHVQSYRVPIPSFLAAWGFLIASNTFSPGTATAEQIDRSIDRRFGKKWLKHAGGEFIKSAFSLCRETRMLLSLPGPILDDNEVFVPQPNVESASPEVNFPIRP